MKTPRVGVEHQLQLFRTITVKLKGSPLFQTQMQLFLQKIVKEKSSESESERQQRSMLFK